MCIRDSYVPGSARSIVESLRWLGVELDEGPARAELARMKTNEDWDGAMEMRGPYAPYVQSQRLEIYQQHAEWLVERGLAYRANETSEELDHMRGNAQAAKQAKLPIFTIAYGTEDGYVVDQGRREPVPVNFEELQRVADISGGKAFEAGSASELKEVYANIAAQVGYVKQEQEVTEVYTGYALFFAVLAAIAVISLGARWP